MKVAVISDTTYRASTPDYPQNLAFYGSEPYHAVLAKAFHDNGHEVHWFAPAGSEPIGNFHKIKYDAGLYDPYDTVTNVSFERYRLGNMASMDFVIDMSAACMTVEELHHYYGFKNYLCYRNGFSSFAFPRLRPEHRHYVVPSAQNALIFKQKGGFDAQVAYYGIPDFYCPGSDSKYFDRFAEKYGLEDKKYFLFTHRPTPEKGVDVMLHLAKMFPAETFVIAGATPVYEHQFHLMRVKIAAKKLGLKNIKFVSLPEEFRHHYFKRELMRRAKAMLSPFAYPDYLEGFGLGNAEAVACGTPLIITNSPSTQELWRDSDGTKGDSIFATGIDGFKMAIRHFDSYTFDPHNRYTVEAYYQRYLELALMVMMN